MVQNNKSKKAKQAQKATPVNDSEELQPVQSELNGEQNSVAVPESSTNGARSATTSRTKKAAESAAVIESTKTTVSKGGEGKTAVPQSTTKSRTKKAAESAAEIENIKTTVSEGGEGITAVPKSKSKGRPKKGKNMEINTVETTEEPGTSGNTKENEEPSERPATPTRKRKAASPAEGEGEEVEESESAEITAPVKKSRKKEATSKDTKEEAEQESAATAEPEKKVPRKVATAKSKVKGTEEEQEPEKKVPRKVASAKSKAKEIKEEAEEVPAETSEPETKSRKRKAAEPKETKSKTKKQKALLSFPPVGTVPGKVFVVGENDVGQLGFSLEDVINKTRPTMLELPYSVTSIAAGGMHSVCLTESGEVITFGCNDEGALGRTADGEEESIPGGVEIPERVIQISAGDSHTAALTEAGHVYLWGNFRGGDGPLGCTADGKKQVRPMRILSNIQIIKISSGADHLACLSSEGIVYTCGCGQNGQLGRLSERHSVDGGRRGLAALLEPAAVPVIGIPTSRTKTVLIQDVWATNFCTFLKAQDTGHIYAFGLNNYTQLGYQNEQDARSLICYLPKQVTSFDSQTWREIAGGQHHTLSLDTDGLVHSIGRDTYGRLGLGENSGEKSAPTLITSLEREKCSSISCGDDVSFSVTEEGSLYSWGMGSNNQLGHGNEDDCQIPRLVEGNFGKSWKTLKVSGGGQHTLILATPKESVKSDSKK